MMKNGFQAATVLSLFLSATVFSACAGGGAERAAGPKPLSFEPPLLDEWEDNMVRWGRHWGEYISRTDTTEQQKLNAVYYDASRVFYQISDYTGDKQPWTRYASTAEAIYIGQYARPNAFKTSGYWRFPHGIYLSWQREPTAENTKALIAIRDEPAFSDIDARDPEKWHWARYSREIAYAINAHVTALRAGLKGRHRALSQYVDAALEHLEIWRTGRFLDQDTDRHIRKPFMFGLTGEALIAYQEYLREQGREDKRITPALRATADWFWRNMWVADADGRGHGAFKYIDRKVEGVGEGNPAPDLNLLIAPVYAWLYKETGDVSYRRQADAIFEGGVALACLKCSAKVFNQNYRSSFDYIDWRRAGDRSKETMRAQRQSSALDRDGR